MGHTPRWAALRASASVATAVLLASCHGEPIGPDAQTNVPVASVIIQPAVDTLRVGAAQQLVARVLDADGHDLTRLVAWQSLAPTILSLTSGGGAVGLSAGTARVVASSEQESDTASIVELPVPVRQVIVTPNAPPSADENFQNVARRLASEKGWFLTDQFCNPANVDGAAPWL